MTDTLTAPKQEPIVAVMIGLGITIAALVIGGVIWVVAASVAARPKEEAYQARLEGYRAAQATPSAPAATMNTKAGRAACADAIDKANYANHHLSSEQAITAQTAMLRACDAG